MDFVEVEVVVALGVLFTENMSRWGYGRYPPVATTLGELMRRPESSLFNKASNIIGTLPHRANIEKDLLAALATETSEAFRLWQVTIAGARAAGISAEQLPDLLRGQDRFDDIGRSEIDHDDVVADEHGTYVVDGLDQATTERLAMTMARIGQGRFHADVTTNYRQRCGFCGLDTTQFVGHRLLTASHVKPWRSSTPRERLDPRNGVAACPTHDAAFDTGLLTVTQDGRIHRARLLREASKRDRAAHAFFSTGVAETLIVDPGASPSPGYLDWHHEHVWMNGVGSLG